MELVQRRNGLADPHSPGGGGGPVGARGAPAWPQAPPSLASARLSPALGRLPSEPRGAPSPRGGVRGAGRLSSCSAAPEEGSCARSLSDADSGSGPGSTPAGRPFRTGQGRGPRPGQGEPPRGEEGRAPQGGQCFWVTGVRVERPWSDLTDAASEGFCRQASACGHTRTPRASAEGRLGHSTAPGSGVRARCVALTECPSAGPCWARSVVGSRRPGGRPPFPRAASGGRC